MIDGHHEDRSYFVERLGLSLPDYRILQAAAGEHARQTLQTESIDCVVLELELPDMSGFQILLECVPVSSEPSLPIIVLTRVPNRDIWDLARKHGAYACLWKWHTTGDLLTMTILRGIAQIPPTQKETGKNEWSGLKDAGEPAVVLKPRPRLPSSFSKLRLRTSMTAVEITFRYVIRPVNCDVKLYRTPIDPDPLMLSGPRGFCTITLHEPQTLYYELQKNCASFTVWTESWREPD
ncbi:hypothetical protein W02_31110 [Nitrospira sp. KM1]|uniref:response regulator n=1 Tax=Nitrospira sp. KM1 TaxID=1936990 RepID=UPI0013A760F1|nr:response regulator [Nitrospira sp. KM1]BCA55971.1 hypothetical protein W02_31110 [Nitrospira sp. KM1]